MMIGFNIRVPKLRGSGSKAVMAGISAGISPGMRGGFDYARQMAQNWHKIPVGGKMTGTAVWMDINIHWNEFVNAMGGVLVRVVDYLPDLMEGIAIFVETRIKERIRATLTNTPKRTGRLSSDWSHRIDVLKNKKTVRGVVGTKVIYAPVHEFGKTIYPRSKQALTVPFPGNVGVYPPAKDLMKTGLTYIKKDVIFYKQQKMGGQSKESIPIYILKKSVNIPARPFVGYVMGTYGDRIVQMLGDHVKLAIRGKGYKTTTF